MAEENVMGVTLSGKPFVQIACVCEKVLIEPDNVASLVRIVDTYLTDLPEALPEGIGVAINLTAFISLKSGDVIGESEVGLRLTGPTNETRPVSTWPVEFRGAEAGVNLKIEFTLKSPKLGLYWFDVLWQDEVLTRIPFRLKPKQTESTVAVVAPNETATH